MGEALTRGYPPLDSVRMKHVVALLLQRHEMVDTQDSREWAKIKPRLTIYLEIDMLGLNSQTAKFNAVKCRGFPSRYEHVVKAPSQMQ